MSYKRGDVILVKFPKSDLITYKKRPGLVVQDETVKTGLSQRLIIQITSNLKRTGSSRLRVRQRSPEGQQMGLLSDSVIVADNIATVKNKAIDKVIGTCPIMGNVEASLKTILGL